MGDPQSTDTSPIACKLILEKHCEIFEYIVDDITKQVDYSCAMRHSVDSEEYLRSLTLNLLGNILMEVPKHSTLISLIQEKQWIVPIVKSLLWYVQMARYCPSNASLAAKCLRLFAETNEMSIFDTDPNLEREARAALIAIAA